MTTKVTMTERLALGLTWLDRADLRALARVLNRLAKSAGPPAGRILTALASSALTGILTADLTGVSGEAVTAARQAIDAAHLEARAAGDPDAGLLLHLVSAWGEWQRHRAR